MAYTGAWKRTAGYYFVPDEGRVHTADPAHAITDAPDPIAFVYTAPLGIDYTDEAISEYPGMEWVTDTPGLVLDMTPRQHEGGDTGRVFADDPTMLADSGARHGVDYGAARAHNYVPADTRAANETFDHERFEVPLSTAIDPTALQRGLNGLALNNPDGYRPGHNEWFRPNRKFLIGERRHDHRPLTPNTATTGTDRPPVPTQYGTPFAAWARAITNVNATPVQRREPEGISQAITADLSHAGDAYVTDWVVG